MTSPCPSCGRPRPFTLPIIGIQRDLNEAPALILYNCLCRTTRAVKWAAATPAERHQAYLAELSRLSRCEMAVEG